MYAYISVKSDYIKLTTTSKLLPWAKPRILLLFTFAKPQICFTRVDVGSSQQRIYFICVGNNCLVCIERNYNKTIQESWCDTSFYSFIWSSRIAGLRIRQLTRLNNEWAKSTSCTEYRVISFLQMMRVLVGGKSASLMAHFRRVQWDLTHIFIHQIGICIKIP